MIQLRFPTIISEGFHTFRTMTRCLETFWNVWRTWWSTMTPGLLWCATVSGRRASFTQQRAYWTNRSFSRWACSKSHCECAVLHRFHFGWLDCTCSGLSFMCLAPVIAGWTDKNLISFYSEVELVFVFSYLLDGRIRKEAKVQQMPAASLWSGPYLIDCMASNS